MHEIKMSSESIQAKVGCKGNCVQNPNKTEKKMEMQLIQT